MVSAVERVLAACPKLTLGVDVSLDAVGDAHDALRGVPGLFSKAVATLRELQRIERRVPRFNVNIETTVTSFNDRLLDGNLDYFTRVLKPSAVFTLLARGRPRDPAALDVDIERYLAYAVRLEGRCSTAFSGGTGISRAPISSTPSASSGTGSSRG